MLTKSDLSAIREVIREEVEAEVKLTWDGLIGEMKFSRLQIGNELRQVENRLKNIEIQIKKM